MPVRATRPGADDERPAIRVAAAGDIHAHAATSEGLRDSFEEIARGADLILLAGDLTTYGEPEQGAIVADACRGLGVPVLCVLGNHDWHSARRDELVAVLAEGEVAVLDPGWAIHCIHGVEIGIAGAKGFVGGFPGCHLPDFGEPSLRSIYAETGREAAALDDGLRHIALCDIRIALLHYSPIESTLDGEPREIWAFLGSDRLAPPLIEHQPDLVLHGHAHAGRFEGRLGDVPVHNVAVPVMGQPFWVFELTPAARAATAIR